MKILPTTCLGKWSAGLIGAFVLLLATGIIVVSLFHQTGGNTFFDNLYISVPMLSAGIAAIAAGFSGIISIWKHQERSALAFAATAIGLLVLFFVVGEFSVPH